MLDHKKWREVLNSLPEIRQSGFTLVEIMIVIVILTIMAGLAVPSFQVMLQNTQIRNAAESVLSGLQRARAEAVNQNTNIEFVLGWTDVPCAGLTLVTDNCASWQVRSVGGGTIYTQVNRNEGSQNVSRLVTPAGSNTITFDNTGRRLLQNDATAVGGVNPILSITFSSTVLAPADSHNLQIDISSGGAARMCDPSIPASVPPTPRNPRAC